MLSVLKEDKDNYGPLSSLQHNINITNRIVCQIQYQEPVNRQKLN